MIGDLQDPDWKLPKGFLAFQNHPSNTTSMEARVRKTNFSHLQTKEYHRHASTDAMAMKPNRERGEFLRSFSNGNSGKKRSSYFSLESFFLLFCLTASLLILPLILPPLPPPPFLLLLLPIVILALLMILAFMPSNVRDLTYTYM
uniref:ARGOS-like protein n=1 Tax=Opuntia streptacantha TaxID=393608 RepID=A0A7C8Z0T9_OPUST